MSASPARNAADRCVHVWVCVGVYVLTKTSIFNEVKILKFNHSTSNWVL